MGILSQTFGDKLNNFQTASSSSSPIQVTTTSGKQYSLDGNQVNWIKSRYKQDGADTYGWDDADQYAKQTGQLSAKMRSTYKNSNVDRQLAEMGLPSEKNLEKYIADYQNWHTGTVDQRYRDVPNEQWTKMSEFYKNKWTYEDTTEDQLRKLNGQMPKALLSKYQDNELDESLMARNLPPAAELYKYGEQYVNYQGINAFYANVAGRWTELRMNNELDENGNYLKNDDTVYKVNGKEVTGRELFTDAFYDELLSTDDQGNYKYANILPLFKNNHVYESEQKASEDYNIYRGKEVLALGKGENLSDDYSNYEAFSYDNFESQYGDYFSKYFANMQAYNVDGTPAKFDDGSAVTISDALAAFDKAQTEKERKEFYSIDKLASEEDDSSVSAFLRRWRNANPTKGYYDMFNDMRQNGVDEKNIKAAKDQVLKSARNMGKDEVKLVKEAWATYNATAPVEERDNAAGGAFGKNYATKEEADVAVAKQIFIDSFDSDTLMRHMANYDEALSPQVIETSAKYFESKGVGSVAISDAMKAAKAAYIANTDSVDDNIIKAFDSAIQKDKNEEYSKHKADYWAFKRDAIAAAVDPSTISTSELYITNRVNVLGGEVTPDVLYQIVKSTAELSWSNKYSVKEALLNLGFTDSGEFTDPEKANTWTKNWTEADRIKFRDLLKQNGYRSINELEDKPDTTPEWEEPTKDDIALMKDAGLGKEALIDNVYRYIQSHGGWGMEDRDASVRAYFGSLGISNFAIADALISVDWRYLRGDYKESPSLGNTEDYLKSQFSPDDTLAAGDYQIARDWMDKMIADGELTPFEAYNVLCGEGLQDEIIAFDEDGWHEAIYKEKIVPEMFNVADGTTKLYWESLGPEGQRLKADELWNAMSDEDRAKMFADYDWRYDPSIYRTAGQAWSQQLIATLPSVVTNITSGTVGFTNAVASIVSGDQNMWDVTKNAFAQNQSVASFGAVTDGVNGAQVAQLVTDATAELVKMYTLGAVGGSIAEKVGGATGLTFMAESPFSTKGVQKFAGMAIDLLKASPFSMMATGNAYAEAKTAGASNAEALPYAFVVGGLEGIIESFNVDKIWGEVLGNGAFGKMLVEGQGLYKAASVVAKARLASIPIAFLGEATEEGLSYLAEALWKTVATYSGSEWAKDFEFSWKELGEQMLMGGITGALGATLGSSQITKDSIMLDYYRNNGKVTAAIGDADLSTTWWSTYSNEQQLTYRKGGWRIMNLTEFSDTINRMQENWRTLHSVNENDPESIPNMQQAYERLKASEDAKVNTLTTELNNLRAEMKGLNPYDQDYKNDMERLTAQIVSKENALTDAKTKRATALRASETAITSKKAQAEEQYSAALNKMNAHFAGIYLRNEGAIKAKNYDAIEANMANARVNGDDSTKPGVTNQNAPVDANQQAGYNTTGENKEANANGVQGTETAAGVEAQAGGNAGVSEQAGAVGNPGGQESGTLGRADTRVPRFNAVEKLAKRGLSVVRMGEATPEWFHEAIGAAKQANPYGAFVDQKPLEDYGKVKTFISPDGGVGVAVTNDGDIVSVFKNSRVSKRKNSVSSILFTALDNGGKKLDNFNSPELSQMYLQHGFVPVARIAFNDDYAPDGWNYERDGRPDIYFWVHNGDDADTILEKMGTYEMPDPEDIPLFTGPNAYDEAYAARDAFASDMAGWGTDTGLEAPAAPKTYKDYMTTEAVIDASRAEDAKDYVHKELASMVNAVNDHVNIPSEVWAKHPTVVRAEAKSKSYQQSTLEEYENDPKRVEFQNETADKILQRGSAVFENGKLKKVDGKGDFSGRVAKGHRAAIVIGPPGSGKSDVITNVLSNQTHSMILDNDDIKEEIPENDGGRGAGRVHEESKVIFNLAFDKILDKGSEYNGNNIIIPKVGSGSGETIVEMAKALKAAGYKVDLYLSNVSDETSFNRAMARFAVTGRYIDQGFLNSIKGTPLENFKRFTTLTDENGKPLFDYAEWRDNDVKRGEDPILKWKTGDTPFDQPGTAGGGSVEQTELDGQNDAGRGGREGEPGVSASAGEGATVQGSEGSKFQAALNGAKVLSDSQKSKIINHVKRIGFKGTLSFINDPEQVFDGRIQNGDITLNLAYITPEAAQELKDNPGFWVLKHEFTHFIENSKEYLPFFRAVRSQMIRELGNEGFVNAAEAYRRAAAEAGHPFNSYADVVRDMVADYVGSQLFTSQKAIDSFVREQEGAASRVYNWLRYVIDRGKLRRQKNAAAIRVLDAERMYSKAFRDANKKPAMDSNANYSTPGIDYDLIKSRYGLDENGKYVGVANPRTGVTAEEDAQYMEYVKSGRLDKARKMVRDLFERNGWLHAYHAGDATVGDYTALRQSGFDSGKQYFMAAHRDMSESYLEDEPRDTLNYRPLSYGPEGSATLDEETGAYKYGGELAALEEYADEINKYYGTGWRVDHMYMNKNTGEILVGEDLEDAIPSDVESRYSLYDSDGLWVASESTAAKLAYDIKRETDPYGVVDNPLAGNIYELYFNPENANYHRAYNTDYSDVPDDSLVEPEHVYNIFLREGDDGFMELVVTNEAAGKTEVYPTAATGIYDEVPIRDVFEAVFGKNEVFSWGGRDPYDVFMNHAQTHVVNDDELYGVLDMYIGDQGQEIVPRMYDRRRSRTIGRDDAAEGYEGTIISNVYDYASSDPHDFDQRPGDVYMARKAGNVKAADTITYDNKGNVIPLSLRLNTDVSDMRFSTPGLNYNDLVQRYGTKPQGREVRARDVDVPNMAADNLRVSDLTRSVLESPKVDDATATEIQGEIASDADEIRKRWSYIPKSNDETMRAAKDYISKVQPTEAKQEFHDMVMSGKYSLKTEAVGLQLLADAADRNDWQAVKEIAIDLRVLATDAGQRTQLFNVLKDLKGVGSAWYIENLVKKLNTWYADDIRTGKIDGPITVSQEAMDQVRAAKTQAEVEEAERAVAKEIAPQLPLKVSDKLSNWRYLSMLGNPVTHIRNVTGNTLMAGMSAIKDVVASGVQRLVEKTGLADESDRTHAWLSTADKNMWEDFAEQSYEEQRRNLQGGGKLGFQSLLKQSQRSFDNKYLDAIARGVDNGTYSDKRGLAGLIENIKNNGAMGMLEVEDAWGLRRAYKKALMEHMVAQGYTMNNKGQVGKFDSKGKFTEISTEAMNKAIDWATNQAWTATFRGPSKLASMLNDISKMNTASKMIVEGVMPFKKTPINIAKTGGMYSPAGIIIGTTQLLTKVKQGKMSAAQAIDNLSAGLTGSALMALGIMLAKAGILRAGGEDKKKYETYLQDTGDQTYSFKFGNVSVNMSAIAPATIPLFMGVALNEMVERNDGSVDLSAITDTIAGTLNPFMEMSFMSSLNNALKSYNNDGIGGALGSAVTSALQNYGSQYLPTLGGKIAQFADPTLRSTKSSAASPLGGNADYYLRSLAKKVPGATTALQPDVDIWGRTTTKDSFGDWALDFANKFILPTNVKITNRDAVDKELIRVVESTGVTDFLPSDGNKYFTVKGQKYTMNARQYAEYSQDRGQAAYAAIKEVMASPSYVNATDDVKADMLNKAKEAAYKSVNTIWKEKLGALD